MRQKKAKAHTDSCVNACRGIPDPERTVPEMIAVIKLFVNASGQFFVRDCNEAIDKANVVLSKLEEEV